MYTYDINTPIGLTEIRAVIQEICEHPLKYRNEGPKFLVRMDAGEGRTTLMEYMTAMFMKNQVLAFNGGEDEYVEQTCSLENMGRVRLDVTYEAAFCNEDDLAMVIGHDLTPMAVYLADSTWNDYLQWVRAHRHCGFVFFVSSHPNNKEEKMIRLLEENFPKIHVVESVQYTVEEVSEIMAGILEQNGIEIEDPNGFNERMTEYLTEHSITTVGKTNELLHTLLEYVEKRGFRIVLGQEGFQEMMLTVEESRESEREDVR